MQALLLKVHRGEQQRSSECEEKCSLKRKGKRNLFLTDGRKQPKGEDRTNKKEARCLRCTLLNGSAWSTERKYMKRYKGKCDIFFGIEHRLRKEEMVEQFNKEAME